MGAYGEDYTQPNAFKNNAGTMIEQAYHRFKGCWPTDTLDMNKTDTHAALSEPTRGTRRENFWNNSNNVNI